ncbi:GNAT family N-acetyltransferase [Candidatus Micrarchaeota archaeon]|nr:GNAT family N-acetyltransferase [Candidatus Micrarchaeota archaeon]
MKIKIRAYTKKDAEAVGRIFSRASAKLKKANGGLYADSKIESWVRWGHKPEEVHKEFEDMNTKLFVAVINGKVVGSFGYQDGAVNFRNDSKLGDRGGFARLRFLYTDPDFKGRGIAGRLFDKVMDEVRKEGYKHAYVYVVLSAHGFYQKKGFIHVPALDSYSETQPYDPEINRRISIVSGCTHKNYTKIEKTPVDFFFEKLDI